MSTYQPQPGVFPGRPPCANCAAAYRLHTWPGWAAEPVTAATVPLIVGSTERLYLTSAGRRKIEAAGILPQCPEAYRPDTLEAAERELAQAEALGDQARVFVARGNLQRLSGRRPHG